MPKSLIVCWVYLLYNLYYLALPATAFACQHSANWLLAAQSCQPTHPKHAGAKGTVAAAKDRFNTSSNHPHYQEWLSPTTPEGTCVPF